MIQRATRVAVHAAVQIGSNWEDERRSIVLSS